LGCGRSTVQPATKATGATSAPRPSALAAATARMKEGWTRIGVAYTGPVALDAIAISASNANYRHFGSFRSFSHAKGNGNGTGPLRSYGKRLPANRRQAAAARRWH